MILITIKGESDHRGKVDAGINLGSNQSGAPSGKTFVNWWGWSEHFCSEEWAARMLGSKQLKTSQETTNMISKSYVRILLTLFAVFLLPLPAVAQAGQLRILHSFQETDGDEPTWLLQASDGTLYGVTFRGGSPGLGNGVLYKVDRAGTFTVIHTFTDTPDGSIPSRLIQASDGSIYGLAASGGSHSAGTIYRIDSAGTYSILHSFNGTSEGDGPTFLMQATDGFFYGTTSFGGTSAGCVNNHVNGTLFRMDSAGSITPLHTFCESLDGSLPNSIFEAADGFFYGTCKEDGPFQLGSGNGTFWKSDTSGNVTLLHVFGPTRLYGAQPTQPNGVVQAADGFFYGASNGGGGFSSGAVFKADSQGNVTTLHSFNNYGSDGSDPETNFSLGRDGFFYGTAKQGGLPIDSNRTGVVYRADTSGHVWVLHTFTGDDGAGPASTPILGLPGKTIYVTATFEGAFGRGVTGSFASLATVPIANLVFSPNPVLSGQSTTATLTLRQPAPAQGQVVSLFATNSQNVPPSVIVPAGQNSLTFTINTTPIGVRFEATVTASIGSLGLSAPLKLLPSGRAVR